MPLNVYLVPLRQLGGASNKVSDKILVLKAVAQF